MTLNFESPNNHSKKKSKTKYKAALGVGSAVSLLGIGSTLAANITLSGDNSVEFGQGVVTTAACDDDGFTITPVTYFDNQEEIFKVDYVQVSGVNLTPEGYGYNLSGSGFANQAAAKLARPGQYYTGTEWKNTCDGVVLDFKAYTDDSLYIDRTVINVVGSGNLQNPIGWYQDHSAGNANNNSSPGFALVIDTDDRRYIDNDSSYINWAVDNSTDGDPDEMNFQMVGYSRGVVATSTFKFYATDNHWKTDAASISKITVQSMNQFPSSYKANYAGLGSPAQVDID